MGVVAILEGCNVEARGRVERSATDASLALLIKEDGHVILHDLAGGLGPAFVNPPGKVELVLRQGRLLLEARAPDGQLLVAEGRIRMWLDHASASGGAPLSEIPLEEPDRRGVDEDRNPPFSEEEFRCLQALKLWRTREARARNVSAFIVATNAQLRSLVRARPRTLEDLAAIPGIGPSRIERYGAELLRIVAEHAPAA